MGLTWKKLGKGIGKVVNNKYTKLAAAGALGLTGVGAPAAAAIIGGMSAGGKLAEGKRLTTALKSGAKDGALTYVGGKALGSLKGGIPAVGSQAAPGGGGFMSRVGSMIPGSGIGGKIASVGKFALDNSDLIMGGLGAAEGMKDDHRSRDLMNQALAAQQSRNVAMGQAADRLGGLQRPDLSSLYSDPLNPYARKRIPAVGMGA